MKDHARQQDLKKATEAVIDEKPTPDNRAAVRRLMEQNRRERKGHHDR